MTGRIQLAINVDDLDESIGFYSKLFGAEPAKVRPGYANFALADPPLKLILMENPGQGGSLNHLGVEGADTDAVDAEQQRLAQVGRTAAGAGQPSRPPSMQAQLQPRRLVPRHSAAGHRSRPASQRPRVHAAPERRNARPPGTRTYR